MAKFSHKQMGKENGPASEYAQPHTMKGKSIDGTEVMKAGEYVSNKSAKTATIKDPLMSGVSYGVGETKTDGIKIRGTGAATKGVMARGPMA